MNHVRVLEAFYDGKEPVVHCTKKYDLVLGASGFGPPAFVITVVVRASEYKEGDRRQVIFQRRKARRSLNFVRFDTLILTSLVTGGAASGAIPR